jgi:hypothetical protein
MKPDDFVLKPHHIVEAKLVEGQTHLTIQLMNMTWSAKLIRYDGNLIGLIRDEYDVPLEDGQQIMRWLLGQPEFLHRICELAETDQPAGPHRQ